MRALESLYCEYISTDDLNEISTILYIFREIRLIKKPFRYLYLSGKLANFNLYHFVYDYVVFVSCLNYSLIGNRFWIGQRVRKRKS